MSKIFSLFHENGTTGGMRHVLKSLAKECSLLVRLLRTGQFLAWKYWVTFRCMVRCGRLFNPHETLWVKTDNIVYACNLRTGDSDRWRDRGKILGGEWDTDTLKFEDTDVYRAYAEKFIDSKSWCETDYYKRLCLQVSTGKRRWGKTREDVIERMLSWEKLYRSIKDNGYLLQSQMTSNQTFQSDDEIAIRIGRHGQLLFEDGRHRLAAAKLIGIETVPVKVMIRHSMWRDHLVKISKTTGGNNRSPDDAMHSDLQRYNL